MKTNSLRLEKEYLIGLDVNKCFDKVKLPFFLLPCNKDSLVHENPFFYCNLKIYAFRSNNR